MHNRRKNERAGNRPSFTVRDEIRRDRHMRRTGSVRRARSAARSVLTAVLCIVLCALLLAAIMIALMRAEIVTVSGNKRYAAETILQAAEAQGAVLPLLSEQAIYTRIAAVCPYVEQVRLQKRYPNSVEIVVYEAEVVYATAVHGEHMTMDKRLRVMDYTEEADGLVRLTLPEIRSAVEGKQIEFSDPAEGEFVCAMLAFFFEQEEASILTALDLTDRYDIVGMAGDNVQIRFGDEHHIENKMLLAKKMLQDAVAAGSERTLIDVSEPARAGAQYDYMGEF